MRRLQLKSLSLLSKKERAARKVTFDPRLTVIKGGNDTGKSHIIKSIYWALGAEPAEVNPSWKKANIAALLEFSVEGLGYSVVRHGRHYGIFDGDGRIIAKGTGLSGAITNVLSDILDFGLLLFSRAGKTERPPPAYCFIPFYIDQDAGWQKPWQSFSRLAQYSNWKKEVIYYHTGIRPNDYYQHNGRLEELKAKRQALEGEYKVMEAAYLRVKRRRSNISLDVDPASFHGAITQLLNELSELRKWRTAVSNSLSQLSNDHTLLSRQSQLVKTALQEIELDYKYATDKCDAVVVCPTCGAEHENSIAHRFSLREDGENCRAFLFKTNSKLEDIEMQVSKQKKALGETNRNIASINKLLEKKKGRLTLGEVVNAKGEKIAFETMQKEVDRIQRDLSQLTKLISGTQDEINRLSDPDRKKEIVEFYLAHMSQFLQKLHATGVSPSDVERIDSTIKETGSDRPRVILAYFMACLHTIERYSSACMCPIVIDTPKQQDLDNLNAKAAFDLIFNSTPRDSQVVLGTVDLDGVQHRGSEIVLTDKRKVLQPEAFDEVNSVIRPLLDQIM